MSSIITKTSVKSNTTNTQNVEELFKDLINGVENKKYKTSYEFFNTDNTEFIKPVIDIDIKSVTKPNIDDVDVYEETKNTMIKIFGNDIKIIMTTDHRRYKDGEKKEGKTQYAKYKFSYHFIITNKKINPIHLGKVMRKFKNDFKYEIDTSIYKTGDTKFRLPLTIKEKSMEIRTNKKTYMKIEGGNTIDNFKLCCLTLTDNLDELKVKLETEKEKKKERPKTDIKILNIGLNELDDILDKFDYNEPKQKDFIIFYDLNDFDCPFNSHDGNNKRFLIVDLLDNKIYLKCHSDNCKNKKELILDNVFEELIEFDLSLFMKLKDYKLQKKYFENRIIYLSDVSTYKQIKMDNKGNILLEDISYNPIGNCKSIFYNENGEPIESNFSKLYLNDDYRKIYKNTFFYPQVKNKYKKYFNEFRGFAYENILPYNVDKDKVYEDRKDDIEFYLKFLKDNVCYGRDDILNYFLCLLSFYIKYPHILNHIILVLYSNEQGTGKSSFLDFLFRIIGLAYTANAEIEQVLEKHSNLGYKKIINVIEELSYEKGYNHSKKLKNKSQAETTQLNEKCEKMRTIQNFVHYIITTNEYKSIVLEPNDRRHFILEFKKLYDQDNLIERIEDLYTDDEFIYCFGRYLKEREEPFDFKRINMWIKKRPLTDLYRLMIKRDSIEKFFTSYVNYDLHKDKKMNEDNYEYYIKEKLNNGFKLYNNEIIIKPDHIYNFYTDYCGEDRKKFTRDNFIKELIDIKKFVKKIDYNDEYYLKLDLYKIKNHLRLLDNEIRLKHILKVLYNDNKPEKIKYQEIDEILSRKADKEKK